MKEKTVQDQNMDNSNPILQYKFEALTEEYKALRDEINQRLQKQQEITSFAIALIVGIIALNQFLGQKVLQQSLLEIRIVLPITSIILSAFSLMVLEHEVNIGYMYIYIDSILRPQICEILSDKSIPNNNSELWLWNKYRAKWQHNSGATNWINYILAFSKYSMTVIPNIIILSFFIYSVIVFHEANKIPWVLFVISIIILFWVFLTSIYAGKLYLRMIDKNL